MARGDRVIANSRFTADLISSHYPVPPENLHVIYRGFDVTAFDAKNIAPERIARLREAWGLEPHQRVVLQAARLTRWKGHRYTIEAARRLKDQGQLGNVAFIFAGDPQGRDDYREELRAEIDAAGLTHAVRLVGHCDDIPAAFLLSDIAVVASTRAETFGRTSVESQAAGCPVIVSDIGAASENVVPQSAGGIATGWVVPTADAVALAECLAEALALSPQALAAMGQRAHAHASEQFALHHMQQATLGVYDELLSTELAANFRPPKQF
jgi:glycosyltransferase involved in cell wall biosynthesis